MSNRLTNLLAYAFACFAAHSVAAQDIYSDSISRARAVTELRSQYRHAMGITSFLYTGEAYDPYWKNITGHPFFANNYQFEQGSIDYDGSPFANIPLVYDIYRDELITKSFAGDLDMKLLSSKLRSFSFGGRDFVRLWKDSINRSSPATGFYERLYTGEVVSVFARHEKILERSRDMSDNLSRFKELTHYYVVRDGKYERIDTEKDLQSVLADRKAEIRKFLGRRDISFRKNKQTAIVQAVAYYEQLKK